MRTGLAQSYLIYGVTVLWAQVAIVFNQYGGSPATTGTAAVATAVGAMPVVLAIFGVLRGGKLRPDAGPSARPQTI